jgi:hypothetical protein
LNRKIEFIPVSFHSLFAVKLIEFDGFILFYDRDRKAAANTMTYLEKHISTILENRLKEKVNDDLSTITHPPIYILSCVKDPSLLNIRKFLNNLPNSDYCVQCHSGTIRHFLESHFLPFLHQCSIEKYGKSSENIPYQSEELLAGVTSYFDNNNRTIHSSTNDLMTTSLERTRQPLINSNRIASLNLSSKSNEHSPKHHHRSVLTPTNQEQSRFFKLKSDIFFCY